MKITEAQRQKLSEPLPEWALKAHPIKPKMTVIHPMAVIDRLNEVFGIGGWNFHTREIDCTKEIQKTKNGNREVWMSSVHGVLVIPQMNVLGGDEGNAIVLEQFGGSTNDDKGDALKGGATDALTKIASYLGIGASIYKGQGNKPRKDYRDIEPPTELEEII
jgi:hypothetical protein